MKNIYLDNIIFSLQHAGGISKYWSELLRRILESDVDRFFLLDYENSNLFRQELSHFVSAERILKSDSRLIPIWLYRYMDVSMCQDKSIFHSSYYRVSSNRLCSNITTVHDFTYELFASPLRRLPHAVQKKRAIFNSEIIICVSQNTKVDLLTLYPEIGDDRVYVVNNGVDDVFTPLSLQRNLELKSLYNFNWGSYILYVGDRKAKYKNFNFVVSAAKERRTRLLIVGGGPLSTIEYNWLCKDLGINNFRIEINVSSEKLNLIYNNAICLIYPSRYEGFGIPILEAQAAGCPVLTTNFSCIPEIAGQGAITLDNISVESLSEGVLFLLNDSYFRRDLIRKGFENVKKYSWDRCYNETIKLYDLL